MASEDTPAVLVLLDNVPLDFSTPSNFSNPEMICHFEMILRMFLWHPDVSRWFQDVLGYRAKLTIDKSPFYSWGLTATFRSPGDLLLFKIAFAQPLQGFA